MLIGIGSFKGSPGATVLGLGLAAVWPGARGTVFVEADPSGGDIAVWHETGEDPGLVSFVAAGRRSPSPARDDRDSHDRAGLATPRRVDVMEHAYDLGNQLYAVPGPVDAEQARAAVGLLADRPDLLRAPLRTADGGPLDAVVVDFGRLEPAAFETLHAAVDVMLVVSGSEVRDLAHLAARGPALADLRGPTLTGVLLAEGCRYRLTEVEDTTALPVLAVIPRDRTTAATLAGTPVGAGWRSRRPRLMSRPLLAVLRQLAVYLTDHIGALTDGPNGHGVAGVPPRVSPTTPSFATTDSGPTRSSMPARGKSTPSTSPSAASAARTGTAPSSTPPSRHDDDDVDDLDDAEDLDADGGVGNPWVPR